MNIPGFTAEASFSRSSAHYQAGGMLPGLRQRGEVLIQPALRPNGCRCNIFGDCCTKIGSTSCCCFGPPYNECICV